MSRRVAQRRAAVAAQLAVEAKRRQAHADVAARLQDPLQTEAQAILQRAAARVSAWEQGPCSPLYIWAWRRILRKPAERITRYIVQDRYGMANALAQISPVLSDKNRT